MAQKSVTRRPSEFKSEQELSRVFSAKQCIRKAFRFSQWDFWETKEMEGLFGVPDHIAVFWKRDKCGRRTIRTIAFEMKREKWRKAIVQAYRYASFANYSFVVLDHAFVHRAKIEVFKQANIGLLSVDTRGNFFYHFRPKYRRPYSEQMCRFLLATLDVHLFEKENHTNGSKTSETPVDEEKLLGKANYLPASKIQKVRNTKTIRQNL